MRFPFVVVGMSQYATWARAGFSVGRGAPQRAPGGIAVGVRRPPGEAVHTTARVAALVTLVGAPRLALAWATTEHQELGAASYRQACADVAPAADGDARALSRLEQVCGRNLAVQAALYGDATAVAGDFVAEPTELISPAGAWRFSSPKHYYLLALENSAHFNPMATQSWTEYHQRAVDDAVAAAALEGLPAIERWGRAFRENAFADHFLQDSFAAGHMAFNRRASSAGAAKTFHDDWNARGRLVRNREGSAWTTFGDGLLDDRRNVDGRRHVLDAATRSVRDVMLAYVTGRRHPAEELAALNALPFAVQAPTVLVDAQQVFVGKDTGHDEALLALAAAVRPARKDTVGLVKTWAAAPFSDSGSPTWAATGNVELAIPVLPAQASFGAGGTLHQPDGRHSAVLEAGLLAPLVLSLDGLVSHEVEVTASVLFASRVETIVHLDYQANVELGRALLSVHAGLAEFLPSARTGWYGAVGLGFIFTAAGGGAL